MMSSKSLDKSKISKILVISLTNIGDVILTFPVIDILRHDFPNAKISAVVGPKAFGIIKSNPIFHKVHVYDKRKNSYKTFLWILELKKERFDLVVDLRNSAIPFMIFPRYRTSLWNKKIEGQHMKEKHLLRLKTIYHFNNEADKRECVYISKEDEEYVARLISEDLGHGKKFVVIAPSAADHNKRWKEESFAQICDYFIQKHGLKIVFVGDSKDKEISSRIIKLMKNKSVDLSGRLTLLQLASLLKKSFFSIVNDSAPMHLASYLDIPVVAIFGPTDPKKYGPWSKNSLYFRNNLNCEKCKNHKLEIDHTCNHSISCEEVVKSLRIENDKIHFK